jgi:uncharacterized protein (DUF1501 family)
MKRRDFLKLSAITASSIFMPSSVFGAGEENMSFDYSVFDSVNFNSDNITNHSPQILAIFLAGGSSQLAGNLTNFTDIKRLSESSYPNIDITENGFWNDAGGEQMEEMLANNKLSVVRTIFRSEDTNTRSHGIQTVQNQVGSVYATKSGFFTDILYLLNKNGVIDENTVMPSLSFTGGTPDIYKRGDLQIEPYLNFSSMDSELDNPYSMKDNRYLVEGADEVLRNMANEVNSADQTNPLFKKAYENFIRKDELSIVVDEISAQEVSTEFPDNTYGNSIKSSLKMMIHNPDTKLSFIEFGGWDDHSGAINNYKNRMSDVFEAVKSGTDYLEAEGNRTISIWVFTEFGRNVNLNKSLGWDHGNIFNLFVAGNNPTYLEMGKIIGETEIFKPDLGSNRVYMRPIENSESYEPFSIASTIEKIFGITNPEVLTGYEPINSILKV